MVDDYMHVKGLSLADELTFLRKPIPGVPCSPTCGAHITHPCEKCGQQWPGLTVRKREPMTVSMTDPVTLAEFVRGQTAIMEAALAHSALCVDLTKWVWLSSHEHAICIRYLGVNIALKPNDFAPLLVAIMMWMAAGKPRYAWRNGKDVY